MIMKEKIIIKNIKKRRFSPRPSKRLLRVNKFHNRNKLKKKINNKVESSMLKTLSIEKYCFEMKKGNINLFIKNNLLD